MKISLNLLRKIASLPLRLVKYRRFISSPVWAIVEITANCPCRCSYCDYWETSSEELSTQDVKTILTKLKNQGVLFVGISGGEPLMRRDLSEIVSFAKDLGLTIGVITSGFVRSQKVYEDLMKAGINTICFSVDGACAQTHEKYRPVPPFATVVKAIRTAVSVRDEGGFPAQLSASTVVNRVTVHELKEIAEFCRGLGLDKINFQPIWDIFEEKKIVDSLGFHRKDQQLLERARDVLLSIPNSNIAPYVELLPDFYTNYEEVVRPIECYAGRAFVYVDAKGTLLPCSLLREPIGSMLEEDPKTFLRTEKTRSILKQAARQQCDGCTLTCYQERNLMMRSLKRPRELWEIVSKRFSTVRSFD